MFDGPKVALMLLAVLLPLIGIGIYLLERRHSGRGRKRGRDPERLPLFGTDQISIRTADGYEAIDTPSAQAEPTVAPPPRPARAPPPLAPSPASSAPRPVSAPPAARPSPVHASVGATASAVPGAPSNGAATAEHPVHARRAAAAAPSAPS